MCGEDSLNSTNGLQWNQINNPEKLTTQVNEEKHGIK
jgi:hypothetical protein